MKIKYAIFDVGGVCYPYSLKPLNDWAKDNCKDEKEFLKNGGVRCVDYNSYMRGDVDFFQFSKGLCERVGIDYYKGIEITINEKLHEGVGEFYNETLEVMEELKEKGIRVGLLSNALSNLSDTADFLVVDELCFVSYELRCLKPEKEIYEKMIDKLGCKASQIIFIDDKEKNVKSAQQLGIRGVVFNRETLRRDVFNIIRSSNFLDRGDVFEK
ncbi:MAG: HAD-IA family hydrolase [Alphaproteobacteria bacterium]|nr:HAD-IA family hydrolase [Alphaproteobacteria bacterium]